MSRFERFALRWAHRLQSPAGTAHRNPLVCCREPACCEVRFALRRGWLHPGTSHRRSPRVELPGLRHGESICLVPREDGEALAQAIVDLAGKPGLRGSLGRRAAVPPEQFAWDKLAAQTGEVYRRGPIPLIQQPELRSRG